VIDHYHATVFAFRAYDLLQRLTGGVQLPLCCVPAFLNFVDLVAQSLDMCSPNVPGFTVFHKVAAVAS